MFILPGDIRVTDDIVTRLRESSGQGCTCEAYSYYECGCTEAIWAEMFINDAADEIENLRSQLRVCTAERDHHHKWSKTYEAEVYKLRDEIKKNSN
jgi:hypothetical protein